MRAYNLLKVELSSIEQNPNTENLLELISNDAPIDNVINELQVFINTIQDNEKRTRLSNILSNLIDIQSKLLNNLDYKKLKERVLHEIDKKGFPDLKFLYSDEVLDNALHILRDLLQEEKDIFEKLLSKKKEEIVFDDLMDGTNLSYFHGLLEHLQLVDRNEKVDNIIDDFNEEYVNFLNEMAYSKEYFDILKYCLENCKLDKEQKTILKRSIRNYKLRGIDLDKDKQERLKEIGQELSKLSIEFGKNLQASKQAFSYHIEDESILKDLPEQSKKKAKENAKEKGLEGYLFTSDPNLMDDISGYCTDSNVRKDFAFANVGFASEGEFDNRGIILDMIKLRDKKAKILAYKNYFELSLEKKMAESPEQIKELLEGIFQKAKTKAKKELEELKQHFGLENIEAWDIYYYSRKYKEEKYNIDSKKIKEYFEFDEVLKYLFDFVKNFYGVEMKQIQIPTYSDDVRVYEVYRNSEMISYFFIDPFSRDTKRGGAWADDIRNKFYKDDILPIISNVCNIQKGEKGETLLTLDNVRTIFHEFGHALHAMLGESKYSSLSGFKVEWDFVELPSQLNENWMHDTESLSKMSKHYKTGESLPSDIVEKLEQLNTYMSGLFTVRQNEFGLLDLGLHTGKVPDSVEELDKKILDIVNKYSVFKRDERYKMYCGFNHIFIGGYSAGYYSYMWAEILEADIFSKIKEKGIFNPEVGKEFLDTILAQGSKKPAQEMFYDFMKRGPSNEAFMNKKGF